MDDVGAAIAAVEAEIAELRERSRRLESELADEHALRVAIVAVEHDIELDSSPDLRRAEAELAALRRRVNDSRARADGYAIRIMTLQAQLHADADAAGQDDELDPLPLEERPRAVQRTFAALEQLAEQRRATDQIGTRS